MIPSMTSGKLRPLLQAAVDTLRPEDAVVEVGCWLGASTSHIARRLEERDLSNPLHCFDRWKACKYQIHKAAKAGVSLQPHQDLLPLFRENVHYAHLVPHKGEIRKVCRWKQTPIGIYCDDASKQPANFLHVLKTFGPYWVPEQTVVVLCDLTFCKNSPNDKHHCQPNFLARYPEVLKPWNPGRTYELAFLYTKPLNFSSLTLKDLT